MLSREVTCLHVLHLGLPHAVVEPGVGGSSWWIMLATTNVSLKFLSLRYAQRGGDGNILDVVSSALRICTFLIIILETRVLMGW